MLLFEFHFRILEQLFRLVNCGFVHELNISIHCVLHIFLYFTSFHAFRPWFVRFDLVVGFKIVLGLIL
jgi:hypothetical protein